MMCAHRGLAICAVALVTVMHCSCSLASDQAPPCSSVSQSVKSLKKFNLKPGKYRVTLVAISGKKKGASTTGDLRLISTSKNDISPKTGNSAYDAENLAETPLYGSIAIDFAAVNAPVSKLSGSLDPIYPDVLVRIIDFAGIDGQPAVVIGSEGNRRDGVSTLDGRGIGLFVQEIRDTGFAGKWDAWGIVHGGSGYFCAYRYSD